MKPGVVDFDRIQWQETEGMNQGMNHKLSSQVGDADVSPSSTRRKMWTFARPVCRRWDDRDDGC